MTNVRSITPLPPANFTPEMGNYKTLQPFRYWCQKVLPLVYDDSISYYELLCKVVDYLNKTMEDVETLHGDVTGLHEAYVQLQNYVNTYFSSLDVQEEINNKLDTMASDGTLLEIIEPTISATTISEVNKWLSEHITNPSNPPIDTSLTISGAAADSKTVGNNFKKVEEDLTVQKVVPMTSVNPYNVYLKDYDVRIYSGKYLTGFSASTYTPTMTQGSDFPYDVIDMKINLNNPTITVPFDTEQSVGQTFVLYTEGVQANNATPDNVRNEQIGVIDVTGTSYTVNLNASGLNYVRVAFTVPKNKRDFYFSKPDEGELGKLIDDKLITACVNMFYSIGAIGDSYTAGSALSSDGKTWQDVTDLSWIATMGKRAGIYWSNYGKGGATTKSYITDKLTTVLSGQVKDLYFIALGINDCLQELPIGTISDIKSNYSENGESFYGWYGSIIAQVQGHAPKAKIVLVKIWTNGTAKIPYDNAIDKIAEHFELPVINPFNDYFFNSSLVAY
jgi:lysophospholipase L1-like esterase